VLVIGVVSEYQTERAIYSGFRDDVAHGSEITLPTCAVHHGRLGSVDFVLPPCQIPSRIKTRASALTNLLIRSKVAP
jgi:hypothetical protein